MEITKMDKKYVESGGNKCPVCGEQEVNADTIQVDGSSAWANADCAACGATWTDVYQLIGIDNLLEGKK